MPSLKATVLIYDALHQELEVTESQRDMLIQRSLIAPAMGQYPNEQDLDGPPAFYQTECMEEVMWEIVKDALQGIETEKAREAMDTLFPGVEHG